jgi:hypothetical protein
MEHSASSASDTARSLLKAGSFQLGRLDLGEKPDLSEHVKFFVEACR